MVTLRRVREIFIFLFLIYSAFAALLCAFFYLSLLCLSLSLCEWREMGAWCLLDLADIGPELDIPIESAKRVLLMVRAT